MDRCVGNTAQTMSASGALVAARRVMRQDLATAQGDGHGDWAVTLCHRLHKPASPAIFREPGRAPRWSALWLGRRPRYAQWCQGSEWPSAPNQCGCGRRRSALFADVQPYRRRMRRCPRWLARRVRRPARGLIPQGLRPNAGPCRHWDGAGLFRYQAQWSDLRQPSAPAPRVSDRRSFWPRANDRANRSAEGFCDREPCHDVARHRVWLYMGAVATIYHALFLPINDRPCTATT